MTLSFFLQEDPGGHVHYVVHFFSALKIWFYYALAFQRSLLKTKQKANQKKKAFKRKTSWQEHFPQCMYCKTTAIKKHTLMCQLASNNQCFWIFSAPESYFGHYVVTLRFVSWTLTLTVFTCSIIFFFFYAVTLSICNFLLLHIPWTCVETWTQLGKVFFPPCDLVALTFDLQTSRIFCIDFLS